MPSVSFTANLNRHLDCPTVEADGATVAEVLDSVFAGNPRLRSYILDDQNRLRRHVNIFVAERPVADRARLSDPVPDGAEVFVFQALSGG